MFPSQQPPVQDRVTGNSASGRLDIPSAAPILPGMSQAPTTLPNTLPGAHNPAHDSAPKHALIVAHGSPADPAPQERWLAALAVRVAMWCPGWQVRAATLAAEGALAAALARNPNPVIYPLFMAEGWFTRSHLPQRLAAAGGAGLRQLPAFGHDPDLPSLIAAAAIAGAADHGLPPAETTLLLAAHGSQRSPASARITESIADTLRQTTGFARITTGYVEQDPWLADSARTCRAPALCLPLFATRAGHVAEDVPQALAEARFPGPLLPAIGEHPHTARVIAAALLRA
mgnify:CR=1 FL=1